MATVPLVPPRALSLLHMMAILLKIRRASLCMSPVRGAAVALHRHALDGREHPKGGPAAGLRHINTAIVFVQNVDGNPNGTQ